MITIHKLRLVAITIACAIFVSCSHKTDTTPIPTYVVVSVLDGNSYSALNTSLTPVPGATVSLYISLGDIANISPAYTFQTYSSGQISIPVVYRSTYYMVVQKDGASNIYNNLLVAGIFKSQTEIQQSPAQTPPGTVGGVKYVDVNGDGKIDSKDNVTAATLTIDRSQTNSVTAVIYK